jgi:hypothetical protein
MLDAITDAAALYTGAGVASRAGFMALQGVMGIVDKIIDGLSRDRQSFNDARDKQAEGSQKLNEMDRPEWQPIERRSAFILFGYEFGWKWTSIVRNSQLYSLRGVILQWLTVTYCFICIICMLKPELSIWTQDYENGPKITSVLWGLYTSTDPAGGILKVTTGSLGFSMVKVMFFVLGAVFAPVGLKYIRR